mmetsp:Transcript_14133/g.19332  ORF Transcript_14133/g.19332 Transcript_14133/m.19332 type:complete len:218 (-) Transcript_14133:142-795(-)
MPFARSKMLKRRLLKAAVDSLPLCKKLSISSNTKSTSFPTRQSMMTFSSESCELDFEGAIAISNSRLLSRPFKCADTSLLPEFFKDSFKRVRNTSKLVMSVPLWKQMQSLSISLSAMYLHTATVSALFPIPFGPLRNTSFRSMMFLINSYILTSLPSKTSDFTGNRMNCRKTSKLLYLGPMVQCSGQEGHCGKLWQSAKTLFLTEIGGGVLRAIDRP